MESRQVHIATIVLKCLQLRSCWDMQRNEEGRLFHRRDLLLAGPVRPERGWPQKPGKYAIAARWTKSCRRLAQQKVKKMQNIKCKKSSEYQRGEVTWNYHPIMHLNDFLFCLLINGYMQLSVFAINYHLSFPSIIPKDNISLPPPPIHYPERQNEDLNSKFSLDRKPSLKIHPPFLHTQSRDLFCLYSDNVWNMSALTTQKCRKAQMTAVRPFRPIPSWKTCKRFKA